MPSTLEYSRKIILKGKVYESRGALIMAQETTCSLSKQTFKGVCVGINEHWGWNQDTICIVGSETNWTIVDFKESEKQ